MIQDKNGFMWLASPDGLNRFDGYQVKVYRNDIKDSTSLSNNDIYLVEKDSEGALYIGTAGGGLNKYNFECDCFTHFEGYSGWKDLSKQLVWRFHEDKNGTIWIGTISNGLYVIPKGEKAIYNYKLDGQEESSLAGNQITSFLESEDGAIWIGTNTGLSRTTPTVYSSLEFDNYYYEPGNENTLVNSSVFALMQANNGDVWVGTEWGGVSVIQQFSEDRIKIKNYSSEKGNPQSLANNHVSMMVQDSHGDIWIGTGGQSINRYSEEIDGFIRYNVSTVDEVISAFDLWPIIEDQHNNVWVCTGNNGLFIYNRDKDQFNHITNNKSGSEFGITNDRFRSAYKDDQGNLWLGTFTGGANIPLNYSFFKHYKSNPDDPGSLGHDNILAFEEDSSGNLWVGTDGGGLNILDRQKNTFRKINYDPEDEKSLSSNVILSIYRDSRGTMWLGTWGSGLNRLDPGSEDFKRYISELDNPNSLVSNHVWEIYEDSQGKLWVGTISGGLNLYDPQSDQFPRFVREEGNPLSLGDINVWSINEDRNGDLWMGTGTSLTKLIKNPDGTISFVNFGPAEKDSCRSINNMVTAILEDKYGNFWIGTHGNGLLKFDRKNYCFEKAENTSNQELHVVNGILQDSHANLWISSNNGLFKYNTETGEFKNYNVSHGVQSNMFRLGAFLKLSTGEMAFGGINGFNLFHPDSVEGNTYIPKINLLDLKVFNKSVEVGKPESLLAKHINEIEELVLSYEHDVFTIEFSAINYIGTHRNEYAYYLENFENDWNYVKNKRSATYTNLDPGKYVFRVKASNNDGVWNEEGISLPIIITPPFWTTFWFRAFMVVFLGSTFILIVQYRTRSMRRQRIMLENRVELRTKELTNEIEIRKNTEESLKKTLDELNETQKKLIRTEKMASLANFISGLAHELNNPLNYITGGLSIIKMFKPGTEDFDSGIEVIDRGLKRSVRIVKGLTSMTAMQNTSLTESDINLIIGNLLQELHIKNEIEVETNLGNIDKINIYPKHIEEALRQIVNNAVFEALKINDRDKSKILVETYSEKENEKEWVFIKVFNTGAPIEEEKLNAIFDPFYTTKNPVEGIGLGLSISYSFVDHHGGTIEARNENNGVSFVIKIPYR